MSKHRQNVTKSGAHRLRAAARPYVGTAVAGTAMVGAGVLLAAQPNAPAALTASVGLASVESVLVPLSPAADELWWLDESTLFGFQRRCLHAHGGGRCSPRPAEPHRARRLADR